MIVNALIVAAALVLLALVVGAAVVLREPQAARRRVEALFRRPEKPRQLKADHYYRPYWS